MINVLIKNRIGENRRDQRVLIVHNRDLLGAGIAHLLIREANLDVFGVVLDNETKLLQAIGRYQPDVIIIDETSRVISSTRLLTLLENYPQVRLVGVNLENNLIHIHDKYQALIIQVTDFFSAVKSQQIELQAYPESEKRNGLDGTTQRLPDQFLSIE